MHRFLMRVALSLAHVFAWIFVFEFFYSTSATTSVAFVQTTLLYGLSQVVMTLLIPITSRGLRHSMRRQMLWGTLLAATAFIFLGAVFEGYFAGLYILAIIVFALLIGAYRALYWIPYETERRHDKMNVHFRFLQEIVIALMPAFVGFMLGSQFVHESWLLYGAGVLIVLALVPLLRVVDVYENFPWNYRQTFGQFFERDHRGLVLRAVADGIQGAALLLIWPLVIFFIVGWSYFAFGALVSITLLAVLLTRGLLVGGMRGVGIHRSLLVRAAILMSAWILRGVVVNPISIIIVDIYSRGTTPHTTSIDQSTFEQSADLGLYVDEYTTLREMGMGLGRITICIIAALCAASLSISLAFLTVFSIAALSAGLSTLFSRTTRKNI